MENHGEGVNPRVFRDKRNDGGSGNDERCQEHYSDSFLHLFSPLFSLSSHSIRYKPKVWFSVRPPNLGVFAFLSPREAIFSTTSPLNWRNFVPELVLKVKRNDFQASAAEVGDEDEVRDQQSGKGNLA